MSDDSGKLQIVTREDVEPLIPGANEKDDAEGEGSSDDDDE